MTHKAKLRVFLSYAREDKEYAQKLHHLLSKRPNLRIFTTDILSGGEDWQTKLRDEIARCDLFIVMLSSTSVESKWVLHELGAAWAINKPIIPVVAQSDILTRVPVELKGVQPVEMQDIDKPEIINQILERYEAAASAKVN